MILNENLVFVETKLLSKSYYLGMNDRFKKGLEIVTVCYDYGPVPTRE